MSLEINRYQMFFLEAKRKTYATAAKPKIITDNDFLKTLL